MAPDVFDNPADRVARDLIGATLLVNGVGGRIVETEAYDAMDPASHSFHGRTARNAPMFGPPGRAYVYRIYGLHWCFNVVCDAGRQGSAVLIRAIEPTAGLDLMRTRRGVASDADLCSGPGKLCQALAIDGRFNGAVATVAPFQLLKPEAGCVVVEGRRVGIRSGVDTPWRFGEAGSRFLSRPMEAAPA